MLNKPYTVIGEYLTDEAADTFVEYVNAINVKGAVEQIKRQRSPADVSIIAVFRGYQPDILAGGIYPEEKNENSFIDHLKRAQDAIQWAQHSNNTRQILNELASLYIRIENLIMKEHTGVKTV